ncbi:MAG: nucleoside hydrolase [Dehalococcoidia bacterium]
MPRLKAIVDCDPGHDDAVAILLAAHNFELLGVTTVGGNSPIENVTANARRVLELAGRRDIPVARGASRPLLKELQTAPSVHGESGLDGAVLPEPVATLDPRHAVEFLIETLLANEGVILFPIGPLTNVATAIRLEPRIIDHLGHISLMGGSATWGNATAAAEFNTYVDPEAADIVFRSGAPLTMCGLNLTRQAFVDEAVIARLRALGNETGRTVGDLLEWNLRSVTRLVGGRGAPLHDPCAVAAMAAPEIFEFLETYVAVELQGHHTYGMTVVDQRFGGSEEGRARRERADVPPANCRVAMTIDRERFFDLVLEALRSYP